MCRGLTHCGVGVVCAAVLGVLSNQANGMGALVASVADGSEAADAGLRRHDAVHSVDDVEAASLSHEQVMMLLHITVAAVRGHQSKTVVFTRVVDDTPTDAQQTSTKVPTGDTNTAHTAGYAQRAQRQQERQRQRQQRHGRRPVRRGAGMKGTQLATASRQTQRRKRQQQRQSTDPVRQRLRAAAYAAGGVDYAKLFRHYDRDNSGLLEFEEFRRALRRDAKLSVEVVTEEELQGMFSAADADNSGAVDVMEFIAWLEADLAPPDDARVAQRNAAAATVANSTRDSLSRRLKHTSHASGGKYSSARASMKKNTARATQGSGRSNSNSSSNSSSSSHNNHNSPGNGGSESIENNEHSGESEGYTGHRDSTSNEGVVGVPHAASPSQRSQRAQPSNPGLRSYTHAFLEHKARRDLLVAHAKAGIATTLATADRETATATAAASVSAKGPAGSSLQQPGKGATVSPSNSADAVDAGILADDARVGENGSEEGEASGEDADEDGSQPPDSDRAGGGTNGARGLVLQGSGLDAGAASAGDGVVALGHPQGEDVLQGDGDSMEGESSSSSADGDVVEASDALSHRDSVNADVFVPKGNHVQQQGAEEEMQGEPTGTQGDATVVEEHDDASQRDALVQVFTPLRQRVLRDADAAGCEGLEELFDEVDVSLDDPTHLSVFVDVLCADGALDSILPLDVERLFHVACQWNGVEVDVLSPLAFVRFVVADVMQRDATESRSTTGMDSTSNHTPTSMDDVRVTPRNVDTDTDTETGHSASGDGDGEDDDGDADGVASDTPTQELCDVGAPSEVQVDGGGNPITSVAVGTGGPCGARAVDTRSDAGTGTNIDIDTNTTTVVNTLTHPADTIANDTDPNVDPDAPLPESRGPRLGSFDVGTAGGDEAAADVGDDAASANGDRLTGAAVAQELQPHPTLQRVTGYASRFALRQQSVALSTASHHGKPAAHQPPSATRNGMVSTDGCDDYSAGGRGATHVTPSRHGDTTASAHAAVTPVTPVTPATPPVFSPKLEDVDKALLQDEAFLTSVRAKLRAAAYGFGGFDVARLFRHYDRNNSGGLAFKEFRSALRRDAKISSVKLPDEALLALFHQVNTSATGVVSQSEFAAWVGAPGPSSATMGSSHLSNTRPRVSTHRRARRRIVSKSNRGRSKGRRKGRRRKPRTAVSGSLYADPGLDLDGDLEYSKKFSMDRDGNGDSHSGLGDAHDARVVTLQHAAGVARRVHGMAVDGAALALLGIRTPAQLLMEGVDVDVDMEVQVDDDVDAEASGQERPHADLGSDVDSGTTSDDSIGLPLHRRSDADTRAEGRGGGQTDDTSDNLFHAAVAEGVDTSNGPSDYATTNTTQRRSTQCSSDVATNSDGGHSDASAPLGDDDDLGLEHDRSSDADRVEYVLRQLHMDSDHHVVGLEEAMASLDAMLMSSEAGAMEHVHRQSSHSPPTSREHRQRRGQRHRHAAGSGEDNMVSPWRAARRSSLEGDESTDVSAGAGLGGDAGGDGDGPSSTVPRSRPALLAERSRDEARRDRQEPQRALRPTMAEVQRGTPSDGGLCSDSGTLSGVSVAPVLSSRAVAAATSTYAGRHVTLRSGRTGIVRFVGSTEFAAGLWLGVELATARGKNNGTVAGVHYFTCVRAEDEQHPAATPAATDATAAVSHAGGVSKRPHELFYGLFVRPTAVVSCGPPSTADLPVAQATLDPSARHHAAHSPAQELSLVGGSTHASQSTSHSWRRQQHIRLASQPNDTHTNAVHGADQQHASRPRARSRLPRRIGSSVAPSSSPVKPQHLTGGAEPSVSKKNSHMSHKATRTSGAAARVHPAASHPTPIQRRLFAGRKKGVVAARQADGVPHVTPSGQAHRQPERNSHGEARVPKKGTVSQSDTREALSRFELVRWWCSLLPIGRRRCHRCRCC